MKRARATLGSIPGEGYLTLSGAAGRLKSVSGIFHPEAASRTALYEIFESRSSVTFSGTIYDQGLARTGKCEVFIKRWSEYGPVTLLCSGKLEFQE